MGKLIKAITVPLTDFLIKNFVTALVLKKIYSGECFCTAELKSSLWFVKTTALC